MGYLNINSLRNKILDLREIAKYLELDYFVISDTKIDGSFPSKQFALDNLEMRAEKIQGPSWGRFARICQKVFCL